MTMHPMQECVQRLCNKIDKIKLFANLGARLFQETAGLSRWHLIGDKIFKFRPKCFSHLVAFYQSNLVMV